MPKGFKWHGAKAIKIAQQAGIEALRVGGEAILTEAIDETPVLSGTLRRSGAVTVGGLPNSEQVFAAAEAGKEHKDAFEEELGKEKAVYISFNTPYARVQHEEIGYNHPTGGKAKYLEDPANQEGARLMNHVGKRIREAGG